MATEWEGKSRGTVLGYKIFIFFIKTFGYVPPILLLVFVVFYYFFFRLIAHRAIYYYFKKDSNIQV